VFGPEAASGAKLQDALLGSDMQGMSRGVGPPPQPSGRRGRVPQPVSLAAPLDFVQILKQRSRHVSIRVRFIGICVSQQVGTVDFRPRLAYIAWRRDARKSSDRKDSISMLALRSI
jgi:hypothetical protein